MNYTVLYIGKIQLPNIKRRTKIASFEKLPKVCDVRFCANVFRQSVPRRRSSVGKGAFIELGAKSGICSRVAAQVTNICGLCC